MASSSTQVPITLVTQILKDFRGDPIQADLAIVLGAISQASKTVAAAIRTAPINNIFGYVGTKNSMGEDVKKLDVIANDNFISALIDCERVCGMVSEENGDLIAVPEDQIKGDFVVCFDPLDGSSNIDVAVPVGSIFAVYRRVSDPLVVGKRATLDDVLQPGANMVLGGYAMYGSCTMMIVAHAGAAHSFTLDPVSGEFVLTTRNLVIPRRGTVYSVNEANSGTWHEPELKYVAAKKEGKPFSLRYVGSMVADVHRTLIVGGLFMYPGCKVAKNGKLRLLYECNPMAYILERAGGSATTGKQRVLDVKPTMIHQRVPIYLGSKENVDELLEFMK